MPCSAAPSSTDPAKREARRGASAFALLCSGAAPMCEAPVGVHHAVLPLPCPKMLAVGNKRTASSSTPQNTLPPTGTPSPPPLLPALRPPSRTHPREPPGAPQTARAAPGLAGLRSAARWAGTPRPACHWAAARWPAAPAPATRCCARCRPPSAAGAQRGAQPAGSAGLMAGGWVPACTLWHVLVRMRARPLACCSSGVPACALAAALGSCCSGRAARCGARRGCLAEVQHATPAGMPSWGSPAKVLLLTSAADTTSRPPRRHAATHTQGRPTGPVEPRR